MAYPCPIAIVWILQKIADGKIVSVYGKPSNFIISLPLRMLQAGLLV